jgi:sugar lactone lactonase YvrE
MGTQSIPHPHCSSYVPLRIVILLLLSATLSLSALAQTLALSIPLILPSAIVFDAAGNLYFAETANNLIRKVDTSGRIVTIAGTGGQGFSGDGGPAISATLDSPQGLALDAAGNLYVADTHNHRIRRINFSTGLISTVAGTGLPGFSGDNAPAISAQLNLPTALALDVSGNLYFADTANHRIRSIDANTNVITTIAGNGTQGFSGDNGLATTAAIDSPNGLAIDVLNNLYIADTHNHRIRKVSAIGIITTIAGDGNPGFSGDTTAAITATLALPHGITLDAAGNLYLADTANHRIRRIDASTGLISTVAGDGTQAFLGDGDPAISASLDTPRNTAVSPAALLTLADSGNQRIRQLTAAPAPLTTIQTIAGLGLATPEAINLSAPSVIPYGTGQLTASLNSTAPVTGNITFLDTSSATISTLGTANLIANIATLSTSTLPVGLHSFIATYAGDQTHLSAQSPTITITITPQQLTAAVVPITVLYGQPIPPVTGLLNGVLPQDAANLSVIFTTAATALSSVGIYPITTVLTGSAAGNYTIAPTSATVTIDPAPVMITLSNLVATTTAGSSVTLTAHVASTTSGTPTGSVMLLDADNTLFTTPVSVTGDAAFTIPSITQGSHSFTAFYSGSVNFTSGTSAPQLITVGVGGSSSSPDFTLKPTGLTSQTIVSGSSVSYTFSVQLQGAISSPITLAASGMPNLSTASFNPPTLPPGLPINSFTLTVATPNTIASQNYLHTFIAWTLLLFPFTGLAVSSRHRQAAKKLLAIVVLSVTLIFSTGCGDRINAADALTLSAKSYTVTVTGTATTSTGGILQHSATVTLLLEQPQ